MKTNPLATIFKHWNEKPKMLTNKLEMQLDYGTPFHTSGLLLYENM